MPDEEQGSAPSAATAAPAAATPGVPPPPPLRRAAATEEDPHVERLRAALAGMEGAHPVDLLNLAEKASINEEDIAKAYREVSRRFHPDTFFKSSPVVRGLAEACFGRINGAYESLLAPGGLADAARFLAFRKAGRGFVSEREHQAARVAFKRAELLYRNRDWKGADALYQEALRLDKSTWPHLFHAIRCAALARRLTVADAAGQLDALTPPDLARRAEVLVSIGNLHKLDGHHEAAMKRYRAALEADPNNHDAQREIRLHRSRTEREAATSAPAQSAAGTFSGFFRRGGDRK
jgi:tetratricopeptide (TPR) repeat protein